MMKPDVIHYDRNDLEELLGDRLNRAQREEIESHLYHCESCRHQLQEIAAEESLWNEAGDLLASDELDSLEDGVLTGIRPVDASAVTQQVGSNNQITDCDGPAGARQILAWLQPTDDPAMLGRLGGYEIAGVIGSGGNGCRSERIRSVTESLCRHQGAGSSHGNKRGGQTAIRSRSPGCCCCCA